MSCVIYGVNLETERRYEVGRIAKHTEMNNWLKSMGKREHVYELYKGPSIHSRWRWKEKKQRWGRMATPSKKNDIIEEKA